MILWEPTIAGAKLQFFGALPVTCGWLSNLSVHADHQRLAIPLGSPIVPSIGANSFAKGAYPENLDRQQAVRGHLSKAKFLQLICWKVSRVPSQNERCLGGDACRDNMTIIRIGQSYLWNVLLVPIARAACWSKFRFFSFRKIFRQCT
jgi:hypothetical protein